jgi:hypothetical protein
MTMPRIWTGSIAVLVLLAVGVGRGQVLTEMTAYEIQAAIKRGIEEENLRPYKIQGKARFSWPPIVGFYTTPFMRVAMAAKHAQERYQPFDESDVTPEMIAPELQVIAPSKPAAGRGVEVANVVAIVIMPRDSDDRSQAIHPTTSVEMTSEYKNLFGFTTEGRGILATFPLSLLSENNEIHVVFDQNISNDGAGWCDDCRVEFDLKDIY